MNRKILLGIMMIGLVAALAGAGIYAYFSSTKYSTGNVFTAGTIDLQLRNDTIGDWADGVVATWSSPEGWAPGEIVEAELRMKNIGSTGVKLVGIKGVSLSEHDEGGDADPELADRIFLTKIAYTENGTYLYENLIGYYTGVFDADADEKVTLREFVNSPYTACFWIGNPPSDDLPDYLPPGGARVEAVTLGFTFDPTAENEYQGDWASFDLEVTALQSFEQIELLGWGPASHGYY